MHTPKQDSNATTLKLYSLNNHFAFSGSGKKLMYSNDHCIEVESLICLLHWLMINLFEFVFYFLQFLFVHSFLFVIFFWTRQHHRRYIKSFKVLDNEQLIHFSKCYAIYYLLSEFWLKATNNYFVHIHWQNTQRRLIRGACVCVGVFACPFQNVIYFKHSETNYSLLRLTGAIVLIYFSDMLVSSYRLLL